MRRQARPFVTEYRSGRRGKETSAPQGQAGRDARRDGDGHREAVFPFPDGNNHSSDDGYEAAMKAADALFARKSGADAPSEHGAVHDHPADDTATSHSMPEADHEARAAASHGGGRVLRAIEEPPADRYAALEAERAPKRRGRKPGSKNKPKIKAPESDLASAGVPFFPVPAGRIDHPPIGAVGSSADPGAVPYGDNTDVMGAMSHAPDVATARRLVAKQETKGRGRFPWIRTTLGPGEKWKQRRLPKVAW